MMNGTTLDSIVPRQGSGRKANVIIKVASYSPDDTSKLYEYLKMSILDVNNWNSFKSGITFQPKLVDKNGRQVNRMAKIGDLMKILLPRWQSVSRLYDWREITKIEERLDGNTEIFFITIIPAASLEMEMTEPSHFLRPESSVTFCVVRDEHKLELQIHTRNEGLDNRMSGLKTRLQNAVMSVFIAGGFYEHQWSKLLKAILKEGISRMKISD
ncbi:MAG TPA: hypothetical protein VIL90_03525 [Puia sp.]|jgi:hypothetical protein